MSAVRSFLVPMLCLAGIAAVACGGGTSTPATDSPEARPTPSPSVFASPATSPVFEGTLPPLQLGVFVVDVAGGSPRKVWDWNPKHNLISPQWSPDGQRLAFLDDHGHILDLSSGSSRDLGPANGLAWSPDGTMITQTVYDAPTNAFVATALNLSTGESIALGGAAYASWSPDGKEILLSGVTCETSQQYRIFDVADRTERSVLAHTPVRNTGAFVSPDFRHAAYIYDAAVWIADIDGANARRVADAANALSVSWSPDGRFLTYTERDASGMPAGTRLLDIADTTQSGGELLPGEATGWSPDSGALLLSTNGSISIYSVETRTTMHVHDRVYFAAWSPDGSRLAFVSPRHPNTDRAGLYVYDMATGAEQSLTDDTFYASMPAWSPDGSRIAFVAIAGGFDYGPCL